MDGYAITTFAANMAEQLADQYSDEAFVRTQALVVEIDDGDAGIEIRVLCSDDRAWVQEKFLDQALEALENRVDEERERDG